MMPECCTALQNRRRSLCHRDLTVQSSDLVNESMVVGLYTVCTSPASAGLCRNGEVCVVQDLVLDKLKKVRVKTVWAEVKGGRQEEIIKPL